MILHWGIVLTLLGAVLCEEEHHQNNRQKRFAAAYAGGFPFTFAGAGFPGFGGFPFGGGVAAPSWDYPRAAYVPFPYFQFPVINIPKPWYEGENVCKEVRNANAKQPDEFGDWMNEDFPNVYSDYSSEHESCKGSNNKYVCVKRTSDSSGQVLQATKYECCHGFVRDPTGAPGCIESRGQVKSKPSPIANEQIYYGIAPDSPASKSSSSSATSVDKVPIQ